MAHRSGERQMRSITVHQDQLEYVGLLAAPALDLVSQPDKVVSGLYHAFLGMHSGLADFQVENERGTAVADTVVVNLGRHGSYRFDYERIEWTNPGAGSWELDVSALARGESWLRSVIPSLKFQHHYFTYFAHCWIDGGPARDYLLSLQSPQLAGVGENQGTGLIFRANFPDHNWAIQMTVDHSNVVSTGLYVQFVTSIAADQIPHQETVRHIDTLFRQALSHLGLQLVRFVG
jgi:hypothetical protein